MSRDNYHERYYMSSMEGLRLSECTPDLEDLTSSDFEYLHATEGLSPKDWEGLAPTERLEALQTIEWKLAEI